MSKYALGLDFGTLSARALVAEVGTGREAATVTMDYAHGVMDEALPDGTRLPPDWALQHPGDYLECLRTIVPRVIDQAGVDPHDIVGIGVDATACTLIPVNAEGVPLCLLDGFKGEKHAYPKLWKHHAAQAQADRMTAIAIARGEAFLAIYGGKISSEWLFPKIWQMLEEAPDIFSQTARFIELADWLVFQLTGEEARSSCLAGCKALWGRRQGYPSDEYLKALDPRLEHVVDEKLSREVHTVCSRAGVLCERAARVTGLIPGTAVAVAMTDAHVALLAVGITGPGNMLMIMGTSSVHLVIGEDMHTIPGICNVLDEAVYPVVPVYEAGQCCVGDHFDWFVHNLAPASYVTEAHLRGIDLHRLLTEKAASLKPGENGLIALDWWNGNRSVLMDSDLSGLIVGMTLMTRPEEIYRALIEATAYGTRMIIDNFEENGVRINKVYACGGIAWKNSFIMQIYADVLGRKIHIASSEQTPALASAIMGALAAGAENGGYDDYTLAAAEMGGISCLEYEPDPAAHELYIRVYNEYKKLHGFFGQGGSDVMKTLKTIKKRIISGVSE